MGRKESNKQTKEKFRLPLQYYWDSFVWNMCACLKEEIRNIVAVVSCMYGYQYCIALT